ncbi:MAG: TSUP family transporter [Oscillospiraceae bacterium]|nr:TSUP family transporter [Oscillospiraceae bacterium]
MSMWIMPSLAGLLAGMAGAMGLGGGSVLMLWLTLGLSMEQMRAQGINLLFFVFTGAIALIIHAKSGMIDWRKSLWCALFGLAGAGGGYLAATLIGGTWLSRLFGGFLLVFGLREIFAKDEGA